MVSLAVKRPKWDPEDKPWYAGNEGDSDFQI